MDLTKKVRLTPGLLLTLILAFIPMFGWKIGYEFTDDELWRNIAFSFAKIGAFGGMAMFALSLILSGRYKWYDQLFGGLDKMYIAHRFLGSFSVLLLFIHPVSLSILRLEEGFSESLSLWFKLSDFGIWLGAIALYLLIGLYLWTVYAKAKYETFLKVHRLMGVVFIIGALHAFLSGSILQDNVYMWWYMFILTFAGTMTYIVYSISGDILHRPLNYTLVSVKKHQGNITELELEPTTRILNFVPGQFIYIAFEGLMAQGYHPFSISSDRRSKSLKLAVRETGDFTEVLDELETGIRAKIKGPYGQFLLQPRPRNKQLWIAGGIGVTPFLSGAASLRQGNRHSEHSVELIYATDDNKPFGLEDLQAIEDRNAVFNVTLFEQKTFGYVTLEALSEHITDLDERDIFICGPPPMLNSLKAEAEKRGIADNLKYEEFNY